MEAKYYTPEIESFYVGFEYESIYLLKEFEDIDFKNMVENEDFVWKKCIWSKKDEFKTHFNIVNDEIEVPESIRVKILDREDIESLNFPHIGKTTSDLKKRDVFQVLTTKKRFIIKVDFDISHIEIIIENEIYEPNMNYRVFYGTVKNKSELKRLMTQLGIQ